jgi:hypothetical protein
MSSKSIFLAFTGPAINQAAPALEISPGYECWNLKGFTIDAFIAALQVKIPPLNDNVLRNYRAPDFDTAPDFGIQQTHYDKGSWGILLPSLSEQTLGGFGETLFLLNLYSPHFLYPIFEASDFGISLTQRPKNPALFFAQQNQASRFSTPAFIQFHKAIASEALYAAWDTSRFAHWDWEDWRLFTACQSFSDLSQYENSKQVFGWQRESADLSTILEALFTAEGNDNTEIGYRLRKRLAVLLSRRIPTIETDIKELYKQRSAFVHGSFFQQFHRNIEIKNGLAQLPQPPFDFLYKLKEYVRVALVAYLYLHNILETDRSAFPGCDSVLQLLERAIIDTGLRSTVEKHTSFILDRL